MHRKTTIRTEISALRKAMSAEEVHDFSQQIIQKLEKDAVFQSAQHVLLYSSIQNEVTISQLMEKYNTTKQFYLPVVIGKGEMEIRPYTPETELHAGKFGITEPTGNAIPQHTIDLIICPGVAFDHLRNRLGRGGGYYDRYLSEAKNCTIYAVAYDFQILRHALPTDAHDQKMQHIFTPSRRI